MISEPQPSAAGTTPSSEPTPVSPEQLQELTRADEREQHFAFARKLAALNGYGLATFAVLALLAGLFDAGSWLLAACLGVLAYRELRGRKLLTQYDRGALSLLAQNQLALIGLVCVYAAGRVYFSLQGTDPLEDMLATNPSLGDALSENGLFDDVAAYYRYGVVGFYALVALLTAVFQGSCAYYYWSRRKHLEEFLRLTPAWVVEWKRQRGR